MVLPQSVVGVLLAGGKSSRMGGGDKCLLPLAGKPMLTRIIDRLGGQIGPLAGVHAGIEWATTNRPGNRFVITAATDTPFFPTDLVARFLASLEGGEPKIMVARSEEGVHPVFGLWPVSLAPAIET